MTDDVPSIAGALDPHPLVERFIDLLASLMIGHPPYSVEFTQSEEFVTVTFLFQAPPA